MNKITVIDENNFFKFKLTTKDRRLLKKEFGEKGYKRFLFYNSIGMFSVIDDFEIEIIRQMLKEE
jgi:hypothetical protein